MASLRRLIFATCSPPSEYALFIHVSIYMYIYIYMFYLIFIFKMLI
jgi:hypothetical protein